MSVRGNTTPAANPPDWVNQDDGQPGASSSSKAEAKQAARGSENKVPGSSGGIEGPAVIFDEELDGVPMEVDEVKSVESGAAGSHGEEEDVVGGDPTLCRQWGIATSQPTWGLERGEVKFEDSNWDRSSGRIIKNPEDPKPSFIQVPEEKAWAVSGVLWVYSEVSKLAEERNEPYYQHATAYIGQVLDQFFQPYLEGKEKLFTKLPSPLLRLWQASDYGKDITNLSRGAPKAEGADGSLSRQGGRSFWSRDLEEKRILALGEEFSHVVDAVKARLKPAVVEILPQQDIEMPKQGEGEEVPNKAEGEPRGDPVGEDPVGGDTPGEDTEMADQEVEAEEQRPRKKRVSRESLVQEEEEEEPSRKRFKVNQQTEEPPKYGTGAVFRITQTIAKYLRSFRENRSTATDVDLIVSIQIFLKWIIEDGWEAVEREFVEEMLEVLREMAMTEPMDDADPSSAETIEKNLPDLIVILEAMLQE